MQRPKIESNSVVFAGPFMGEFGWELSHWAPHVRWLRKQYREKKLIVASYPGRHPLYYGNADEFWPLPKWFTEAKYDCDCFEALSENGHYEGLIKYFREKLLRLHPVENVLWTKTPRGFNKVLREQNNVTFEKLKASQSVGAACQKLISDHGDKPVVVLFARAMSRKMFLDIVNNRPAYVEDIPQGLPTRNWPRSHWEDLFEALYAKYSNKITFAVGGTKGGNCLLGMAEKYKDVIDLTGIDRNQSLDITIALLNRALCSISSQSGPSHLSLQCGCPSFIYGDDQKRHTVDDNPLGTDVAFVRTQPGAYNDPPQVLFHDACVYINALMNEKGLVATRSVSSRKGVSKIGMVGVFDVVSSTNIPFGKAFANSGLSIDVLNYRTVARQVGIEKMNSEVIKFAANYDLLIFCKANGISPETISKCSQITKTLWYMMDAKVHLEMDKTYFDMAAAARFNIVTTKEVADLLQSTGINNVTHILQGIDPKQFHPVDNVEKKYDVVFIGQKSKKRETIIGEIKAAGISVKCWGPGWSAEVYGEAFNRACAEGRILLAINNTDSSEDSFSDRMLRYMATGGCVVTEYSKGLEEHLEQTEGSLCKAYWPDKGESFGSLIKEILASPDAMKDMSKAGYEWVLENHTWDKVSQKVLKIVAGGKI